ncbi:MAG: transporter [Candidatus Deferrimicrobiaceae bacterium]
MIPSRRFVCACVMVAFAFSIAAPALGQSAPSEPPLSRDVFVVTPPREAPEKKIYVGPSSDIRTLDTQTGVLSPKGTITIEPSLRYLLSTSDRVAILGFTILPALTVGLIDVRSVDSNTLIGALAIRYGLTNRIELEYKVPYVYRDDTTGTRALNAGSNVEEVFNANGDGLGDMEMSVRAQLNKPGGPGPFYVAGIRVKANNGKNPFEVPIDNNTGLATELPVGSGFWGVQPSVTVIYPSDPVVFFGSVNYLWNMERTINGSNIDPGDSFGANVGMGFALNEKTSMSITYDHSVIGSNTQDGKRLGNSKTTHVGSLLFGISYKLGEKTGINVSLGLGATEAAPDVDLTVRVPFSL